ncbi:MAG TPA: response regulator [Ktedonobacterales bacterium]|jgi:CheY-like chemotaxis protein
MGYGSIYNDVERARATRTLTNPDAFFSSDMQDLEHPNSPLVAVIDDSYFVRRVVVLGLERAGIEALAYADGFAALDDWQSGRVAPPRVLLLDIGMPRLSGYEVAKLIHNKDGFSETRIIMLSGYHGMVDRAHSKLVGASDFIAKPFKSAYLASKVRHALGLFAPDADWPD